MSGLPSSRAAPSPLAGRPASPAPRLDVQRLIAAYYADRPDPGVAEQRIAFGTSGHRGSSLERAFNEWHVLGITQAICHYRKKRGVGGPLFLGIDTHALSAPACATALEVLAGNGVDVMLAFGDAFTPTPALSHAILAYNRGRSEGFADGIAMTPSHNPARDGGMKYNPLHGGPAEEAATRWIEDEGNRLLEASLDGVKRMPHAQALAAATTHRFDFLDAYVRDLQDVVDMNAIGDARLRIGVDPLGGAGVHYWPAIAERYRLHLTVVSDVVDPTFSFVPVDADGETRMDPASPFAMQRLVDVGDRFDIAFACDPGHDRHGIVTRRNGLLASNEYLAVAADYLFGHRPGWGSGAGIGKSVVTTGLLDRVANRHGRPLCEMPVGFKWFVCGLQDGMIAFAGEESAGATFLRRDGRVWTTDKDGIVASLLAAEITVVTGRDLGALSLKLADDLGRPVFGRAAMPADRAQRARLGRLAAKEIHGNTLAGVAIDDVADVAPCNRVAFGGIKVTSRAGWFVARPSGTEPLCRVCAESFDGPQHLRRILDEARAFVDAAIGPPESDAVGHGSLRVVGVGDPVGRSRVPEMTVGL